MLMTKGSTYDETIIIIYEFMGGCFPVKM